MVKYEVIDTPVIIVKSPYGNVHAFHPSEIAYVYHDYPKFAIKLKHSAYEYEENCKTFRKCKPENIHERRWKEEAEQDEKNLEKLFEEVTLRMGGVVNTGLRIYISER